MSQKPPIHQNLAQLMSEADRMLKQAPKYQAKGTVTGPPVQGTQPSGSSAPTIAAPEDWLHALAHHFMNWLGLGQPGAPQAAGKQLAAGGAYLANGGRQRTGQVNQVIDEASK